MDTQACETPMSDHIARFWRYLETEHVRILLDLRRKTSGAVYWDGSSFSDAVAKALVADREALLEALQLQKAALESIALWRSVNIQGEFEGGLRDIIRSMSDCAAAALETIPVFSHDRN
jgi:hypothetical protein